MHDHLKISLRKTHFIFTIHLTQKQIFFLYFKAINVSKGCCKAQTFGYVNLDNFFFEILNYYFDKVFLGGEFIII
jgi:hypothetical protein